MAKIMLVEDDNNLREIYEARLLAEGYEIVSAEDGEQALALAVKEKPDLIISDVMMPKISGFDMLDILRSTPETKNTKVIMMTALSQAEDKTRADKLGADRYLVKSQVTLEDVAKVAREVLSGESPSPGGGSPSAAASDDSAASAQVAPVATASPPSDDTKDDPDTNANGGTPDPKVDPEPASAPASPIIPTPVIEPTTPTPAAAPVAPAATPAPTAPTNQVTPLTLPSTPVTPTESTPAAPAALAPDPTPVAPVSAPTPEAQPAQPTASIPTPPATPSPSATPPAAQSPTPPESPSPQPQSPTPQENSTAQPAEPSSAPAASAQTQPTQQTQPPASSSATPAQSASQEGANVNSQISKFADSLPGEEKPIPPPPEMEMVEVGPPEHQMIKSPDPTNAAADNAANLVKAANDLMGTSEKVEPAPKVPEANSSPGPDLPKLQTAVTPQEKVNIHIAGKKVLMPINDLSQNNGKSNLNDLLQKETSGVPIDPPMTTSVVSPQGETVTPPAPGQSPDSSVPGNTVQPGNSDPHSVAL